jgi:predicted ATPase
MTNNQFINNIRVKNFKSITDANIDLLPLNVVVGRNSAGKSSLMHSILLATQHLSSDFITDDRISLNRNVVNLGTFREVLNFSKDLDTSVEIGIDTQNTSWQIEFAQNRDADGSPREQSREAVIKKIQLTESPSFPNRSRLKQVDLSFEVSDFPIRTTPILLQLRSGKRTEMPLASGKGTIAYSAIGSETNVSRSFDYCLFLPYAQNRIHPLPMETVDFFHFAVEQFFMVCANRNRMARLQRQRSNSSGLVSNFAGDKASKIEPSELSQFFSYLVAGHSAREEQYEIPQLNESRIQQLRDRVNYRDAIEENITRVMNRIIAIRRQPFAIMSDYQEASQNLSSVRELLATYCAAVMEIGISELKALLIPILESLYGDKSLKVLKPLSMEFTEGDSEDDETVVSDEALIEFLERGRDRLTRAAKNVYYLGPIRDVKYPTTQLPDPRNLGPKGEQAVEVLVHEAHTVNDFPLPDSYEQLLAETEIDFSEALCAWLQHFGLAKGVMTEDQGRDKPRMVVQIDDSGNSVDIRSVGQGLSQLLPVIMQCLLAGPGNSLVIIEQPELHLHPKLESQLADFFLACARTGRQLFVETHSEHLINQLRFRIAEDASNETREMIQVLFADQVDGVTRFDQAKIDQYGGLVEEQWPAGFLELNVVAAERLIDAALDKRIHELESVEEFQDSDDEDDF